MTAKPKRKRARSNALSVAAPHGESESIRIRQISNGYVISREGSKRGKYFTHEEFSPTKPTITAARPERAAKPAAKKGPRNV